MTAPFHVHRPGTIAEASTLLRDLGDEAAVYCGGTELLQVMKMGIAAFDHLIDIKGIPELAGITVTDHGDLSIGAAVTHRELERSPLIAERLATLTELEHQVANVRVRNTGSIGGNLCFAEPHSDPATLLMAAGAVVHLANGAEVRTLALPDFILGPLTTARDPDEILVRIDVPAQPEGSALAYRRLVFHERPAASVAVRITAAEGRVQEAVIVVGSVGERPLAIDAAAESIIGATLDDSADAAQAAADLAGAECEAYGDLNGSEDYKRHLVVVLTRRALAAAMEQAK
jgi:carbon-monoxide dehydrogenase medium subunit